MVIASVLGSKIKVYDDFQSVFINAIVGKARQGKMYFVFVLGV